MDALAEARSRWPAVEVDPDEFAAYAAERCESPPADLVLACACAAGDPAALAVIDAEHFAAIDPAIAHLDDSGTLADEVKQRLRDKLFVGGKIGDYRGRGSLTGWLRVAAVRAALDMIRRRRPEVPIDEAAVDAADDVELAYLKRTYRAEFKAAFATAFAGLERRQRHLIRLQAIDGLTVTHIAELEGVHRTTASRWMSEARDALASATKRELRSRLDVNPDELESILRLIRSRLDVSVREFIGKTNS